MDCARIVFSLHSLGRMFERGITHNEVVGVIESGEQIAERPDHKPYPTALLLGYHGQKPFHVVVARDPDTRTCVVVTVYQPEPDRWTPDFRTRRN